MRPEVAMRMRNVVLLTIFAGVIACAKGETIDSGGWAGAAGSATGGMGAGAVGGSGSSTSGTCDLQTEDPACNGCINTTCFASCNACATNQACLDLLDCSRSCSDATCDNTCIGQYPAGEAPLLAFAGESGCLNVACEAECAGGGTCGLTTSDAACDDCMNSRCSNECVGCTSNSACMDLLGCLQGCVDTTCEDTCLAQYPGGQNAFLAFIGVGGCLEVNCSIECGF